MQRSSGHNLQLLVDEAHKSGIELPITNNPNAAQSKIQRNKILTIVETFFSAIESKNDEAVALLIESGLVTTETSNKTGWTPLLVAVKVGSIATVQQLMGFNADVNAFGYTTDPQAVKTYRTPLQLAAEQGNLLIVKLLMETYQADDSLIAPDGQHALRLAAANGHREIVQYLPSRRGGGWRRWKTKHYKAMRRVKKATRSIYSFFKDFLWYIPKFFLWDIPKDAVVLPTIRGAKWLKKHHREVPRVVAEWLGKLARGIWKVVKKVPVVIKGIPLFVKETLQEGWQVIKRTPKAARIVLIWMWGGLKKCGTAMKQIFARLFSLLHTMFAAIASFFRNLTLNDVLNGFKLLLRAIFVDSPKKLWEWLSKLGDVSQKFLETLFENFGFCLWLLIGLVIEIFIHVPKKLAVIFVAFLQIPGGGCKETLIWINPKRA
jgi:hypothetical protein